MKIKQPTEQKYTVWHNPTSEDAKLILRDAGGGRVLFVVPAGGRANIPDHYDSAIQKVKGGVIISGKGPMLKRDGVSLTVHPSLDPQKQIEAEAERQVKALADLKDTADKMHAKAAQKAGK